MRRSLLWMEEQSTEMGDEQDVAEEESGDEQSAHVAVEARHLVLYRSSLLPCIDVVAETSSHSKKS